MSETNNAVKATKIVTQGITYRYRMWNPPPPWHDFLCALMLLLHWPAAPSSLHTAIQSHSRNKRGESFVCRRRTITAVHFYTWTHMNWRLLRGWGTVLQGQVESINGSDSKRQQVIYEDDVVL